LRHGVVGNHKINRAFPMKYLKCLLPGAGLKSHGLLQGLPGPSGFDLDLTRPPSARSGSRSRHLAYTMDFERIDAHHLF
jgi:hypothetical protein